MREGRKTQRHEISGSANPCTIHFIEQASKFRSWSQVKLPEKPVLQVVTIEPLRCARSAFEVARNHDAPAPDRYQVGMSDSIRYHAQFTLHPRLNALVREGRLQVGSVVSLGKYLIHEERSSCVIFTLLEIDILSEREPLYGAPRSWMGLPIPKKSMEKLVVA